MAYGKLPWDEGYQFPLVLYISSLIICILCCELNSWNYFRLNDRWSVTRNPVKTIIYQLGMSLVLTTFVFGVSVYSLNYILFGHVSGISQFLSSLFIALLIIAIETLVFIVRDFQKSSISYDLQKSENQHWTFKSGSKTFNISPNQIAYLYSQKGMVYAVKNDGEKILTQFSSLSELSETYDTEGFFRLNRQFSISHSAVKQVQKDINQKLRVSLEPTTANIPSEAMVSRYTGPEFKKWVSQ
ncbi:hypothetical protein BFP97_10480 [Roseivirga sp. 4D4]|nr:hypothetical protein BFP97_10480 [Roseivirga sp. 4D4]